MHATYQSTDRAFTVLADVLHGAAGLAAQDAATAFLRTIRAAQSKSDKTGQEIYVIRRPGAEAACYLTLERSEFEEDSRVGDRIVFRATPL